jgi:hypothetical protein
VPTEVFLYDWGTQAYAIQQILLRGLHDLDFTIRPSEPAVFVAILYSGAYRTPTQSSIRRGYAGGSYFDGCIINLDEYNRVGDERRCNSNIA